MFIYSIKHIQACLMVNFMFFLMISIFISLFIASDFMEDIVYRFPDKLFGAFRSSLEDYFAEPFLLFTVQQ